MQSLLKSRNNTTEFANWKKPGFHREHSGTRHVSLHEKVTFDITTGIYILTP